MKDYEFFGVEEYDTFAIEACPLADRYSRRRKARMQRHGEWWQVVDARNPNPYGCVIDAISPPSIRVRLRMRKHGYPKNQRGMWARLTARMALNAPPTPTNPQR